MGLFDKIKKSLFGKKKSEEPVSQEPENQELKSEAVESEQEKHSEASSEADQVSATSEEEKPQTSTSPVVEQESEDKEKSEEIAPQENTEISSDTEEEAREEEKSESPLISEETAAADPNEESIEVDEIEEESTPDEEDKETDQEKYDRGLKKTNSSFGAKLNAFFARFRSVDEEFFDELEDLLIESDVGFETAVQLTDSLRDEAKLQKAKSHDELKEVIVEKLVDIYDKGGEGKNSTLTYNPDAKPNVYLFVGVNGAGKTTTIGKLAKRIKDSGKTVMMVAADTFRAGAVEQLVEWGKRDNVEVVTGKEKADPASVVYDGVKQAQEKGVDYLLVDTAGRLQNKVNLMNELDKIERTIKKILPEQPEEVLLVLDGSTGQNALLQAKDFDKTTKLTGLVLTKLDGSSKGGVVLAIRNEMDLPVKLVGLGEKVDDLADFDAEKFAIGLFQGLI
ncbi:signal recognition particle-docking protein FtsY [Lactobacillus sp. PV012]|uniref:signal recognition particle-docking protein FtsY n=1 Tax=Lactobacillus sp. PV012 TaxID=2594494 RepID=UPI0022400F5A|nr:signal recognition particle-docking protein FtsY [Lactobacillus sp. PV012]QNQ82102.1 signal recognition particle-docking protein FtsY [Lactobacillus sp. PV012]